MVTSKGRPEARFTRRQALGVVGAAGVVGAGRLLGTRAPVRATATGDTAEVALWNDTATWDGTVPTEADDVVIALPVMLLEDVKVASLTIEPTGRLVFDPHQSITLESTGNVHLRGGTLRMHPASADIVHILRFLDIDEEDYVGEHTDRPLDSDVGLWVTDAGVLDLAGSPKTAWTRLSSPAPQGVMLITVEDATGWEVGDDIAITPTEPPTVERHWAHHDTRTITALAGNQVALDRPLAHPHLAVTVRDGKTFQAEVLNLSRNVRITGTPEGRAHVQFLHNHAPQDLRHIELRHLGPRHGEDGVVGRYPLHFHQCHDGTRGSRIEGLVGRECGNHTFTTHLSHGVTYQSCVAHDTVEDPFWWDPVAEEVGDDGSIPTHDIVYDRCVAHYVQVGRATRYITSGFLIGAGEGNVARGCVAVGVEGDARSASGFHWPKRSNDRINTWVFEDNLAHNLKRSGIYFWQNVVPRTIVDRFTAYHCATGIYAGAYSNLVSYRDCDVYACGEQGILLAAVPDRAQEHPDETITYENVYVDQADLTDFAVELAPPRVGSGRPVRLIDCTFKGGRSAQLGFAEERPGEQLIRVYELINPTFEGNEVWFAGDISPRVRLSVLSDILGELVIRPLRGAGSVRSEWNARVTLL